MSNEGVGWGNCLIKGFLLWKQNRYRGALVITRSPNFGFRTHTTDEIPKGLVSFVPLQPRTGWRAWVHKLWFRGRFVRRD